MKILLTITLISLTFLYGCSKSSEVSTVDADAIGRHIIGPAQPISSTISDKNQGDVIASLALTRARGWEIFRDVIAEQTLSIPTPNGETKTAKIPRFMTWYSPEDVNRLFSLGLDLVDSEAKSLGTPLTDSQWTESQKLLQNELKTLPAPVQKSWSKFFEANTTLTPEAILGASGLPRTLFNDALIGSVAKQYAGFQDCYPELQKPAFNVAHKPCFGTKLPKDSMMIKANWLNLEAGFRHYKTDAETMSQLFQNPESSWDDAKIASPVPDNILKASLKGRAFALGGLHIVSKEFEDWIWISVWWSDTPNTDFGEDRPEFIQKLGAPWNQYKLCAVSSYVQNPSELEELSKKYPSLAEAYRSVLKGSGASWCSNPYIERGVSNQKTNCIGCHQFAGTDVEQLEILQDPSRFPHFGSLKVREDFPSDYIWSATQGQISWLSTLNNLRSPGQ